MLLASFADAKPRAYKANKAAYEQLVKTGEYAAENYENPIRQIGPMGFESCLKKSRRRAFDFVAISWDVTDAGATDNIEVLQSTNDCLDKYAKRALGRWIYSPRDAGQDAEPRIGFKTIIVIESGFGAGEL